MEIKPASSHVFWQVAVSWIHGHLSYVSFQGNGSKKSVLFKNEPPIKLAGLIAGAKYRLRVYSHEQPSVTSEYVTFETSGGEHWLYKGCTAGFSSYNVCSRIIWILGTSDF